MQVIRQGDLTSELHSVRSKKKGVSFEGLSKNYFKNSSSASKPSSNLKSMVASDMETNTTAALHAQPHMASAHTARKQGISKTYA